MSAVDFAATRNGNRSSGKRDTITMTKTSSNARLWYSGFEKNWSSQNRITLFGAEVSVGAL
jgi:hypothetical protein